jgi:tetratricopeptide (TPR) repeat protein
MKISACITLLCLSLLSAAPGFAKQQVDRMKEDKVHINTWNDFADNLVKLHDKYLDLHKVRVTESRGGYGGVSSPRGDFFIEKKYFDESSGRLLSRVQYEIENPDQVHVMEVFIYDEQGNLQRDYLVAWLPGFRNAPVQTLINFHNNSDELHAFRQFDASGEKIYEQCYGQYFDKQVDISLEDYQLSSFSRVKPAVMNTDAYTACFGQLPAKVGAYINPLVNLPDIGPRLALQVTDERGRIENRIAVLTNQIAANPSYAKNYLERGKQYFRLLEFYDAIKDYSMAIKLDPSLDDAWYGRGMARGRSGELAAAIDDLSVYLERNPDSSVAYTKRGVRRIWKGDLVAAEKDLRQALKLDSKNAEAHDDLAVLLARKGQYKKSIAHLQQTILHDPSYQKGYHNLATVLFITRQYPRALTIINEAIELDPGAKESLLLKGEILTQLGQSSAAQAVLEKAEFMPDGNWSESMSIR